MSFSLYDGVGGLMDRNIEFADMISGKDVEDDGRTVVSVESNESTNLTKQHFPADCELQAVFEFHNTQGAAFGFGIASSDVEALKLMHRPMGTMFPSVGCHVKGNSCFLTSGKASVIHQENITAADPLRVTLATKDKRLFFDVNGVSITCQALRDICLRGTFHLGVTTSAEGMRMKAISVKSSAIAKGEGAVERNKLLLQILTRGAEKQQEEKEDDGKTYPPPAGAIKVLPPPRMPRANTGYLLHIPDNSSATRQQSTVTAGKSGDVVLIQERVKVKAHVNVCCDSCGYGMLQDAPLPEPFATTRWTCSKLEDFDLCDRCFASPNFEQTCKRSRSTFYAQPGGVFFECRFQVRPNGSPIALGVVTVDEDNNESEFVAGTPTEFSFEGIQNDTTLSMRLTQTNLLFLEEGKIVRFAPLPEAVAYSFAIRFTAANQSAKLLRRPHPPSRGSLVKFTNDRVKMAHELQFIAPLPNPLGEDWLGIECRALVSRAEGTTTVVLADGSMAVVPTGALTQIQPPPPPAIKKLKPDMRVMRNPLCWPWNQQDKSETGKVVREPKKDGWVDVRWERGTSFDYRYGKDDFYDVVAVPCVGARVCRNKLFWHSGNVDGVEDGEGVVTSYDRKGTTVTVRWLQTNTVGTHRFDAYEQEVQVTSFDDCSSSQQESSPRAHPPQSSTATTAPVATTNAAPVAPQPTAPTTSTGPTQRFVSGDVSQDASRSSPIFGVATAPDMTLMQAIHNDPKLARIDNINATVDFAVQAIQQKHGTEIPHGITLQQAASIHAYTQESFYAEEGDRMRSADRKALKPMFPLLKLQAGALDKIPRPPQSRTVFRGINRDVRDQYTVGSQHYWWALTSTSTSPTTMSEYAGEDGTLFVIEAFDIVNIQFLSAHAFEEEYILLPGTLLEVKEFTMIGKLAMIRMDQIPSPVVFDALRQHPSLATASPGSS